jgi:hypothetical protein
MDQGLEDVAFMEELTNLGQGCFNLLQGLGNNIDPFPDLLLSFLRPQEVERVKIFPRGLQAIDLMIPLLLYPSQLLLFCAHDLYLPNERNCGPSIEDIECLFMPDQRRRKTGTARWFQNDGYCYCCDLAFAVTHAASRDSDCRDAATGC